MVGTCIRKFSIPRTGTRRKSREDGLYLFARCTGVSFPLQFVHPVPRWRKRATLTSRGRGAVPHSRPPASPRLCWPASWPQHSTVVPNAVQRKTRAGPRVLEVYFSAPALSTPVHPRRSNPGQTRLSPHALPFLCFPLSPLAS